MVELGGSGRGYTIKNVIDITPEGKVYIYPGKKDITGYLSDVKAMSYAAIQSINVGEAAIQPGRGFWKGVIPTIVKTLPIDYCFANSGMGVNKDLINSWKSSAYSGSSGKSYRGRFLLLYGTNTQNQIIFGAKEGPANGNLKIVKQCSNKNYSRLQSVGFKIWSNSHQRYLRKVGSAIKYDETSQAAATEFFTDYNGEIKLNDLEAGDYQIRESTPPSPSAYYDYSSSWIQISIPAGQTYTYTVNNRYTVGNLKIVKVRKDKTSVKLAGVGFKIQNSSGNWVKQNGSTIQYVSDKNSATEFVTNTNGEITINNLKEGKYYAYETKNPNYGYKPITGSVIVNVVAATTTMTTIPNEITIGDAKIVKQDYDDSTYKLAGVKFYIYRQETRQYVKRGTNDIPIYVNSRAEATLFSTDSRGQILIKNLEKGVYTIYEIENPNYYYPEIHTENITIPAGDVATLTMTNVRQTGNLRIEKTDPDSGQPLAGVSFSIRGPETNGTYRTDSRGLIELCDVKLGEYTITETSVGSNRGYDLDDNYIKWQSPNGSGKGRNVKVTVTRQSSIYTRRRDSTHGQIVKMYNTRKYVDISGYAWEDIKYQLGKEEYNNSLFKEGQLDSKDKLLQGIRVELKNSNGNTISSKQTDSSGNYMFEKVLINDIDKLYIEFEYNGLDYENVDVNVGTYPNSSIRSGISYGNKQNSNRASEGSNRTKFNNDYATITKEDSQDERTGKALNGNYNITYETGEYESKLSYRRDLNKSSYNYGYPENESTGKPINGIDQQYLIKANTKNAYQNGYLDRIKSASEIRRMAIDEVTNINLGIKKRKDIDLSLVKDIHTVRVDINGAEHVYRYADRFDTTLYYDEKGRDGYEMEPAVKFGQKYGGMSYTRALYASDISYEGEKPLEVNVTYKIGIKNTSSDLRAIINEITDYYDNKYELVRVGRQVNEIGDVKKESEIQTNKLKSENTQYEKISIKPNLEVSTKETAIYIQLKVKPSEIKEILGNSDEEVKLDNIAEIKSYSTIDESNKSYAAIDVDSQPGNVKVNNNGELNKTFEDDTDKAPGLKLVLQEERKVLGKVFVDDIITENGENQEQILSGKIRQGNGSYEEGEKGVQEVKVQLIDTKTNMISEIWDDDKKEWKTAEETTDANGEFTIGGFVPGEYKVVYVWGNKNYTVQNYKSTIIDEKSYNAKNDANNLEWYKDEFKQKYPNVEWNTSQKKEIRRSDAVDNYETREKIDKQSSIITNANKTAINECEGKIELEDGTKEDVISKMESTTPKFKVNLEYSTDQTISRDEYELNADGTVKMNGSYAVKKQGKENFIKSIDLGIVERAKQVLELTKRVKSAKITLANGSILTNVQMKEDGTMLNEANHAVYLPETSAKETQINFEVDNEIVQGAQLEIEYGLQINNISEIDYTNKEFYLYGKGYGENIDDMVRLNAQNTIDYLDNDISINNENELGQTLQSLTEKRDLISKGLLENTEEMKQLLDETTRVLLISDKLTKETSPINNTKTDEISLSISKLLSDISTEEIYIENSAEIVKVHKTGGSSLETIPGNYIPSKQQHEYDDDKAEIITVIPPTGRNLMYIPYILLAVSSLGIVGIGIVLIKKYILK